MQPRELANSICDTLQSAGFQALLVGGCVRDMLLGREPADYDVATSATPDQVMELFPEGVTVGAQFGVILVPRDGMKVEVATFRSDAGLFRWAASGPRGLSQARRKKMYSGATSRSTDC